MMAAKAINVLRVKRKLDEEPVDGLLLALKRQKCDVSEDSQEIYFKFAATLQSQEEPLKEHLQSVLSKEKSSKYTKWRDPKRRNPVESLREKLKSDHKADGNKKRFDLVNNRRLVFTETLQVDGDSKEEGESGDSETLKLFQLYDVIEDTELMKTEEVEEKQKNISTITCNGVPLVCKQQNAYVFDVYVTDSHIDDTFMEHAVSLQPCASTEEELVHSDESEEDVFEDDDDSNDENNWRNDYPDEEVDFANDIDYNSDDQDESHIRLTHDFENCGLGDSEDEYEAYKARIIRELKEDCSSEEEVSD